MRRGAELHAETLVAQGDQRTVECARCHPMSLRITPQLAPELAPGQPRGAPRRVWTPVVQAASHPCLIAHERAVAGRKMSANVKAGNEHVDAFPGICVCAVVGCLQRRMRAVSAFVSVAV